MAAAEWPEGNENRSGAATSDRQTLSAQWPRPANRSLDELHDDVRDNQ